MKARYRLDFWGPYVDNITIARMFNIMVVSGLVHLYSIGYMGETRMCLTLCLIYFFMLVLFTSCNYLQLFIGFIPIHGVNNSAAVIYNAYIKGYNDIYLSIWYVS